jgi:replicative DNA helicase Mcm
VQATTQIIPELVSWYAVEGTEDLEITEEDEKAIIKIANGPDALAHVAANLAPAIKGRMGFKTATVLSMIGGVRKVSPSGEVTRGSIHCLDIGDPGIAKSQILKAACRNITRSVYINALNMSDAGMTATAVKDDSPGGGGRWTLEAGALVIADNGIVCVDEVDKIKKQHQAALNEAMEQQSVSVAKAGITATLNARAAVLMTANPKMGRYDPTLLPCDQIDFDPALLSRVDLIILDKDVVVEADDRAISEHIISTAIANVNKKAKHPEVPGGRIDPVLIRKYFSYVRNLQPMLTPEAGQILVDYYVKTRQSASKVNGAQKPVPVTPRANEGTVRIAEAIARSRCGDRVTKSDAERAIKIFDTCLREVACDPQTGLLDIDRVATGIPKTRMNLMDTIGACIRELNGQAKSCRKSDIENLLKEKGFSYSDTELERTLDQMNNPPMSLILLNQGSYKWV